MHARGRLHHCPRKHMSSAARPRLRLHGYVAAPKNPYSGARALTNTSTWRFSRARC